MPDLPCPFCGKPAETTPGTHTMELVAAARCPDPNCSGHTWSVRRRWNTRAPAPPSEGIRWLVVAACKNMDPGFIALIVRHLTPAERDACGVRDG